MRYFCLLLVQYKNSCTHICWKLYFNWNDRLWKCLHFSNSCTFIYNLKLNEFDLYDNFNCGCGSVGMMRTAICTACLTDTMAAGQLTLLHRECQLSCCSDSCQEKHQMKTSKIYWTRLKNTICIITLLKLNITLPYQIFTIWQHLF